jgi:hypothetical protein
MNPWPAGSAHSVTVTALDDYGNTAPGYTGTVKITTSDPAATVPANYAFTAADKGVHQFTTSLTLKTIGTQTVTVTDTKTASIKGSHSVAVSGPATHLKVDVAMNPWPADSTHSVTVTALDAGGNTAPDYTGTVEITTSDADATVPASYTFTAADKGVHKFPTSPAPALSLKTIGTQTVTATDTTKASITGSQTVIVAAGPAKTFKVVVGMNPWPAGTKHSVTVTALDAYGNVATGYAGTVDFATGDPQATVPANYTFTAADSGVHTFPNTLTPGLVFKTVGTQTVSVSDTHTWTITGSATVTVQ